MHKKKKTIVATKKENGNKISRVPWSTWHHKGQKNICGVCKRVTWHQKKINIAWLLHHTKNIHKPWLGKHHQHRI